jgi:hypothetical protein
MHEKADLLIEEIIQSNATKEGKLIVSSPFDKSNTAFSRCGKDGILTNIYSFHGPFHETFDLAIALHLCGEATDVALRRAESVNAAGIVVAPCCVGKLSTKAMNPDIYHATGKHISESRLLYGKTFDLNNPLMTIIFLTKGSNEATVSYPISSVFCELVTDQNDWDALSKLQTTAMKAKGKHNGTLHGEQQRPYSKQIEDCCWKSITTRLR